MICRALGSVRFLSANALCCPSERVLWIFGIDEITAQSFERASTRASNADQSFLIILFLYKFLTLFLILLRSSSLPFSPGYSRLDPQLNEREKSNAPDRQLYLSENVTLLLQLI